MVEKNEVKQVSLSAAQSKAIRGAIDLRIAQIKRAKAKASEPEFVELYEAQVKFLEGCEAAVRF